MVWWESLGLEGPVWQWPIGPGIPVLSRKKTLQGPGDRHSQSLGKRVKRAHALMQARLVAEGELRQYMGINFLCPS